ncbi:response regulator [Terasakiella sp. A23]|uniref:response regulator n=1 Tax=Terasakiella sp. FCG-A23 TaxID=3080561 RepID=UPI002955166B|nr:response regulator [Terasakiella sp. A23]MDV7339397.1 response regulator [Terasakiella sp. A23]
MAKYNIDDIKLVVADPNRQLRSSLKGVLGAHGFRGMQDAANIDTLEEIVRYGSPDLILCDMDLDGDVCKLIHRIRHNDLGPNPFVAVILFIEEPSEDIVRRASEAGLDDLQVKPVVAANVINRVEYLIEKRKPFVVTTDYVGPDRRKKNRPGTMEIPSVDVPNTLASKAKGEFNANQFQRDIQKALWDINAQKIERHIFQVGYLVDRLVPAYSNNEINKESMGMVVRLLRVSRDIIERLEDSDFGHIADLAGTLETVSKSLWDSGTEPKHKDLELLPELSAALSATFNMDTSASNVAQKIRSSVQEKYET